MRHQHRRPAPANDTHNGRAFVATLDSVAFFADVGSHLQRCLIERATLLLYFGARDEPRDIAADSLRAFDRFASLIVAVARDAIRVGGGAMHEALVVSADAVFGHLTGTAFLRPPRRGLARVA